MCRDRKWFRGGWTHRAGLCIAVLQTFSGKAAGCPCHTTRHAGPHRAVREVEVSRVEADPTDQTTLPSAHHGS
ncbi:hypothetical protein CVE32_06245, partial [Pseudomonas syringae pv. actinidiae]|nr:hypothetical protein [Pseudomonas syringae pv. actinidiae]